MKRSKKIVILAPVLVAVFASPGNVLARHLLGGETASGGSFMSDVLWGIFFLFSLATLAILVVMFWPDRAARTAQTLVSQRVRSGVVGFLSLFVATPVLLILTITIVLSPLSFVGLIALALAMLFGWVSLGLEVGQRFGQMINRAWAPGVSAGVGTFILTFLAYSGDLFLGFIPCIGWLVPLFVGVTSLGAVVLSRFGSRVYAPVIRSG